MRGRKALPEPRLEEITAELNALSALREKPSGTIRITADGHAVEAALFTALEKLLPAYPGYHLYYPSRRQPNPAFRLPVEALRVKG